MKKPEFCGYRSPQNSLRNTKAATGRLVILAWDPLLWPQYTDCTWGSKRPDILEAASPGIAGGPSPTVLRVIITESW